MKKIEIGQSLTILANIGVIVGILFLVIELRQNQEIARAQARATVSEGLAQLLIAYTADDRISDIMLRGDAGEELSEIERWRYDNLRLAGNRYFENVNFQYRKGLFEPQEYSAQRSGWRVVFANRGVAEFYCRQRLTFSPEFRLEIDALLTTYNCEQP